MKKLSVDLEMHLFEIGGGMIQYPSAALRKCYCALRRAQGCKVNLFILVPYNQLPLIQELPGLMRAYQLHPDALPPNGYGMWEGIRFLIEERRKYTQDNDRRRPT